MVKKLFKHEFKAWIRVMGVIWAIMLTVALSHRIFQFFENDSTAYDVINVFAIIAFFITVMVGYITPTFFGMSRFHKNLFTGEGYLSFTLPVTAGNHLWVKALTATAFSVMSLLIGLASLAVITAGEMFTEICKAAEYFLRNIPKESAGHLAGYCAEAIVLTVVSLFSSHMLFNACICVGQLFRKNRVGAAVGVYFGYYYLCQILLSVLGAVIAQIDEAGGLDFIYAYTENHIYETIHIVAGGAIVGLALMGMLYFAVCHRVMTKKLNLE